MQPDVDDVGEVEHGAVVERYRLDGSFEVDRQRTFEVEQARGIGVGSGDRTLGQPAHTEIREGRPEHQRELPRDEHQMGSHDLRVPRPEQPRPVPKVSTDARRFCYRRASPRMRGWLTTRKW
jgi:hypothetical protein